MKRLKELLKKISEAREKEYVLLMTRKGGYELHSKGCGNIKNKQQRGLGDEPIEISGKNPKDALKSYEDLF